MPSSPQFADSTATVKRPPPPPPNLLWPAIALAALLGLLLLRRYLSEIASGL